MGHVRDGRLPRTKPWLRVVELMSSSPDEIDKIADATASAAQQRLRQLRNDASLAYCFWLLTRIASASRGDDFSGALGELGIHIRANETALSFIAQVSRQAGAEVSNHTDSGPFSEVASLAMRRALAETVGQQGRSLFGSSLDDLKQAFRQYSTPAQFSTIATLYFSDAFARTLRYYVDRELANNIGSEHRMSSAAQGEAFTDALDLYARQTASIMRRFAEEWYSKHYWLDKGRISLQDAQGFTAYAIKKLQSDFHLRDVP